jgi:hypothetical protein
MFWHSKRLPSRVRFRATTESRRIWLAARDRCRLPSTCPRRALTRSECRTDFWGSRRSDPGFRPPPLESVMSRNELAVFALMRSREAIDRCEFCLSPKTIKAAMCERTGGLANGSDFQARQAILRLLALTPSGRPEGDSGRPDDISAASSDIYNSDGNYASPTRTPPSFTESTHLAMKV